MLEEDNNGCIIFSTKILSTFLDATVFSNFFITTEIGELTLQYFSKFFSFDIL